jgi:hypothetical protein
VVRLYRAPGRELRVAELRNATGMASDDLRACLHDLRTAGFLKDSAADIAALAERPAGDSALDELVSIYEGDKIRLVIATTEVAMDRLRNLAGKAFADAFLIRKKSGGDNG